MQVPLGGRRAWGLVAEGGPHPATRLRPVSKTGPRLSPARRRLFRLALADEMEPGAVAALLLRGKEPLEPASEGGAGQEVWVAPNPTVARRAAGLAGHPLATNTAAAAIAGGEPGAWVGTDTALGLPWASLVRILILEPGHPGHRDRRKRRDGRRLAALAARAHGAELAWGGGLPGLGLALRRLADGDLADGAAPVPERSREGPGLKGVAGWISRRLTAGGKVAVWAASRGTGPLWCPECRHAVACPRCGVALLARRDWRVSCPGCQRSWPLFRRCPEDGARLRRSRGGVEEMALWAEARGFGPVATITSADGPRARRAALAGLRAGGVGVLATTVWEILREDLGPDTGVVVPDAGAHLGGRGFRAVEEGWWRLATLVRDLTAREVPYLLGVRRTVPPALASVLAGDAPAFWRQEMQVRQALDLPPTAEMAVVEFSRAAGELPASVRDAHPDLWENGAPWPAGRGRREVALRGHPRLPAATRAAIRAWADAARGAVRATYVPL